LEYACEQGTAGERVVGVGSREEVVTRGGVER